MNWQEVEVSLRKDAERLRKQLAEVPASAVASNASLGTTAMVLALLADAISRGRAVQ